MTHTIIAATVVVFLMASLLPWLLHLKQRLLWLIGVLALTAVMAEALAESPYPDRALVVSVLMAPMIALGSWTTHIWLRSTGAYPDSGPEPNVRTDEKTQS